mmetsp:Transcript_2849/g.8331  ORF Transcript_2849/g.8331 Transcript_2849/m.8331 type:complete len:212 (+) Transcript_2849:92-727(+)
MHAIDLSKNPSQAQDDLTHTGNCDAQLTGRRHKTRKFNAPTHQTRQAKPQRKGRAQWSARCSGCAEAPGGHSTALALQVYCNLCHSLTPAQAHSPGCGDNGSQKTPHDMGDCWSLPLVAARWRTGAKYGCAIASCADSRSWWSYLRSLSRKSMASALTRWLFSDVTNLLHCLRLWRPTRVSSCGSSSMPYLARYVYSPSVPSTLAILTSWS